MGTAWAGERDGGQLDRAVPMFEKALPIAKSKLGPAHPLTLTVMNKPGPGL